MLTPRNTIRCGRQTNRSAVFYVRFDIVFISKCKEDRCYVIEMAHAFVLRWSKGGRREEIHSKTDLPLVKMSEPAGCQAIIHASIKRDDECRGNIAWLIGHLPPPSLH